MGEISIIPCNGCTECCKSDLIFIHPELGDSAKNYLTEDYEGRIILQHKENGDCIYLNKKGCSIHDNRPAICKKLDCRTFLKMPKHMKYDSRVINKKVLQAAKKLRNKMRLMRCK